MTKTDELNLTNLMDNLRKVETAEKNGNADEIAKIRQYCIDALNDYNDTVKKITGLINENRDIWTHLGFHGSRDGFVNGQPYVLGEHDFYHQPCPFYFTKGYFEAGCGLRVNVGGIHGTKQRTGYCGHFEDHDIVKDDWVAESVELDEYKDISGNYGPWHDDLISDTFTEKNTNIRHKFTAENLRKFNWNCDGWTNLKKKADRTRLRTEGIVNAFRKTITERIRQSTERQNNVTKSSEASVYVKVGF